MVAGAGAGWIESFNCKGRPGCLSLSDLDLNEDLVVHMGNRFARMRNHAGIRGRILQIYLDAFRWVAGPLVWLWLATALGTSGTTQLAASFDSWVDAPSEH